MGAMASLKEALEACQSGEGGMQSLLETIRETEKFYLLGQADADEENRARPTVVKADGIPCAVLLSEPAAAGVAADALNLFEDGVQVHAMEIPRQHLFPIVQVCGAQGLIFDLGQDHEMVLPPPMTAFLSAELMLEDLAENPQLFVWVNASGGAPVLHVRQTGGREMVPVFTREQFAAAYREALVAQHPEDRQEETLTQGQWQIVPIPTDNLVDTLLGASIVGVLLDPGQPTANTLIRGQLEKLKEKLAAAL